MVEFIRLLHTSRDNPVEFSGLPKTKNCVVFKVNVAFFQFYCALSPKVTRS